MRVAIPIVVQSPSNGSTVAGATVTITKTSDASNASIYTARTGGGTTGSNQVTTDSDGRCTSGGNELWLEQGTYTFVISGANLTSRTIIRELVAGDGINETVPVGGMLFWPGPNLPTGFSRADGSEISRATFPLLFAAITQTQQGTLTNGVNTVTGLSDTSRMKAGDPVEGTGIQAGTTILAVTSGTALTLSLTANAGGAQTLRFFPHGKAGTTTFTLPNMNQRTAVGKAAAGKASLFGGTGGETDHVLAAGEMPVHNHGGASGNAGAHSHTTQLQFTNGFGAPSGQLHGASADGLLVSIFDTFSSNSVADHSHTISNAGSGSAHENMPPFLACDWIIRHGNQ